MDSEYFKKINSTSENNLVNVEKKIISTFLFSNEVEPGGAKKLFVRRIFGGVPVCGGGNYQGVAHQFFKTCRSLEHLK